MYKPRILPKSQLYRLKPPSSLSIHHLHRAGYTSLTITINSHPRTQSQPRHIARQFSTTTKRGIKDIFPAPDAPHIRKTEPAWPHPPFAEQAMISNVYYTHRTPVDTSDRVALGLMRLLRWGMDFLTRYKHDPVEPKKIGASGTETKPYYMSERKWLIRFIFLESVAGVPGMVAGMLRHLQSIRRLRRDNGWIETLLEEAYNERMHLLTFLKIAQPGPFMKFLCLGAQGVFFNSLFLSYLISPRTVHRFVGYLEEEAVLTYTLAIADLEAGKLPKWEKIDPETGAVVEAMQAPDIAVTYWNMPQGKRSMRDLLLYIRADEAKHREVNHTLANLRQKEDPNPFVSTYKEGVGEHPVKGIENTKGVGWERDEVI